MKRSTPLLLILFLFCVAPVVHAAESLSPNEKATITFFEAAKNNAMLLRGILGKLPKGAELHSHLSGAIYAEDFLEWAAKKNMCIDATTSYISASENNKCPKTSLPVADVITNPDQYAKAVNALSDRNVNPTIPMEGHDQFFSTFSKFSAVTRTHMGEMLAKAASTAKDQNILHLELMVSLYPKDLKSYAKLIEGITSVEAAYKKLAASDLFAQVDSVITNLNKAEATMQKSLGAPASTNIQYIQQVIRTLPTSAVLTQLIFTMELIKRDERVVALNLVAPEDYPSAIANYTAQMNMIAALTAMPQYKGTNVTLHAGELRLGLVPPKDMRFHITEAVNIAGAKRIGHGVSVMYENNPFALLETMRKKGIAVEICLSSNAQILQVEGKMHPFPVYAAYGIPMVLNTDDAGVARTDLTNEYLRAAMTYDLGYMELKNLSRNSLEYSFLSGESLWENSTSYTMNNICKDSLIEHETAKCKAFLQKSPKAKLQWELEKQFATFEAETAERLLSR